MLALHHRVVQSPGNIVSNMDGEKVMFSVEKGKYYNLGVIGGEIWDLVGEGLSVTQLVDRLMEQYEIARETCERHVQFFLNELLEEGLILYKE